MALERREMKEARVRRKVMSAVVTSAGDGWRVLNRAREGSSEAEESLQVDCQHFRLAEETGEGGGWEERERRWVMCVPFYQGRQLCVEGIGKQQRRRHDAPEHARGVDGLDQGQPAHLAQVAAADEVLEGLEVGPEVGGVEGAVPARQGQDAPAEHAQLGVDDDVAGPLEPTRGPLAELVAPDGGDGEVDGDVDARAEDEAEARQAVDVGLGQEGRRRVVDDGGELDAEPAAPAGRPDDVAEVLAHEAVGGQEALAHAL